MQTGKGIGTAANNGPEQRYTPENRWCEKHGYFIDADACRARAEQRKDCRRCFSDGRQLSLPFPEPF